MMIIRERNNDGVHDNVGDDIILFLHTVWRTFRVRIMLSAVS